MSARRLWRGAALAAVCLLTGCHHHAAVKQTVVLPPPAPNAGPVMVSVPPPTHVSTDASGEVPTRSDIPVVKPVRPPKKAPRRAPPVVAVNTPPPTPPAAPQPTASASAAGPTLNLGQLTSSTDDPTVTRDGAAQALRRERDRIAAIPASVQNAHPAEIDQARRFLKAASDSWNAADYAGTLTLTTKARVLLDDLLK